MKQHQQEDKTKENKYKFEILKKKLKIRAFLFPILVSFS